MNTPDRLAEALADRYRIERELGAGGMATVYLAADLKHDRKVAIKVLKPELAAVLGAERFVVEIRTTASLQHPQILPLFDSGTADGSSSACAHSGFGGRSMDGFREKNPIGRSTKLWVTTGMMGQSSGRGTWWKPSVSHATRSVFTIGRLADVQLGSPCPAVLTVG